MGVSLNGGTLKTPQNDHFLVGKPIVLGNPILGNPHIDTKKASSFSAVSPPFPPRFSSVEKVSSGGFGLDDFKSPWWVSWRWRKKPWKLPQQIYSNILQHMYMMSYDIYIHTTYIYIYRIQTPRTTFTAFSMLHIQPRLHPARSIPPDSIKSIPAMLKLKKVTNSFQLVQGWSTINSMFVGDDSGQIRSRPHTTWAPKM